MKASLCRLSPCTVARVCDYHTKLFLMAVTSTLKSLLRPHFLNTPDKSPGDRLAEICAKITDVGGCAAPVRNRKGRSHLVILKQPWGWILGRRPALHLRPSLRSCPCPWV